MTEEEAKTKWCPHIRFVVNASIIGNRFNTFYAPYNKDCKCIASKCMMWLPANGFHRTGEQGHCGLINTT